MLGRAYFVILNACLSANCAKDSTEIIRIKCALVAVLATRRSVGIEPKLQQSSFLAANVWIAAGEEIRPRYNSIILPRGTKISHLATWPIRVGIL